MAYNEGCKGSQDELLAWTPAAQPSYNDHQRIPYFVKLIVVMHGIYLDGLSATLQQQLLTSISKPQCQGMEVLHALHASALRSASFPRSQAHSHHCHWIFSLGNHWLTLEPLPARQGQEDANQAEYAALLVCNPICLNRCAILL